MTPGRGRRARDKPEAAGASPLPGLEGPAKPPRRRPHSSRGRVERALDRELTGTELTAGARTYLRALAAGVDLAEHTGELEALAKVGRVYLEARQAYGLAGGGSAALDPFAAFVAGMSAPHVGDEANT